VIEAEADDRLVTLKGSSEQLTVDLSDLSGGEGASLRPTVSRSPDRIAYAIYTSGTTGTPKGVLVSQGAFSAAVFAAASALGLDGKTKALCVSPFHFDGSYATLFSTLFVGGSVVMRPRDALLFPRVFVETVTNEGITYTSFSPTYLRLLATTGTLPKLASTKLKMIGLGGEALSVSDVKAVWAVAPQIRLFNRYGPTETTIAVTNSEVTPDGVAGGNVPIGRPHPGTTFHILDESGAIVEGANEIGELYVGGDQLMVGYLGDPTLTAQVIRDDLVPGERVYKTGDLVFRDDCGCYVYFDRADRVIKRNGVRISLVELTQTLQSLSGIKSAVCATFDQAGRLGIVAFIVLEKSMTPFELQVAARDRLPGAMIPDCFETVDALPFTSANKIDERLLLQRAGLRAAPRAGTDASVPAGTR
jgi:D-alanine--poly(phosphoribitol) ligase subunit 1